MIQQALGGGAEKIYRKVDSLYIAVGDRQIPRLLGAATENHRIILSQQVFSLYIAAHIHTGSELYALSGHLFHPPKDHFLLQLHVRDSVHQQAAGPVRPLKYSDLMTALVELIRSRQPRRAGTDHGNPLSGAYLRDMRRHLSMGVGPFDNAQLILFDRDRVSVQAAGAGRLAQRGADSSGKLGKIIGFAQPLIGQIKIAGVDQIIPLRHQVMERAAGKHPVELDTRLTEGDAALHTAAALLPPLLLGQQRVKFIPMLDALQGLLSGIAAALVIQKSGWFSHYCSPPLVMA